MKRVNEVTVLINVDGLAMLQRYLKVQPGKSLSRRESGHGEFLIEYRLLPSYSYFSSLTVLICAFLIHNRCLLCGS